MNFWTLEIVNNAKICKNVEKMPDSVCEKCKKMNHGTSFSYETKQLKITVCEICISVLFYSPVDRFWQKHSELNKMDQQECQQCHIIPNRIVTIMFPIHSFTDISSRGNQEESHLLSMKQICFICLKKFYQSKNKMILN